MSFKSNTMQSEYEVDYEMKEVKIVCTFHLRRRTLPYSLYKFGHGKASRKSTVVGYLGCAWCQGV